MTRLSLLHGSLVQGLVLAALLIHAGSARAQDAVRVDLGAGVAMDLVRVAAGIYQQGSPPDEEGRGKDEGRREVTITRDFLLGKTEVTRGQFARFCAATGYKTEAEKGDSGGSGWDGKAQALVQRKGFTWRTPGFEQADDHPVCLVTYEDAVAFCGWLGTVSRRDVRLPTEAEWEYAARGGTDFAHASGPGDDEGREGAWCKENAGNGTRPVGKKAANPLGLFDMGGNVYEWCRDFYHADRSPFPASDPEDVLPDPKEDKARRVLKGGSWWKDVRGCRPAARHRNTPGSRNADNGFRILASVDLVRTSQTPASEPGDGRGDAPGGSGSHAALPPAQSAPSERTHVPAGSIRSDRDGIFWGCCCAAPALVGLVAYLKRGKADPASAAGVGATSRPAGRGPSRGKGTGDLRAEPADDGFRLFASHLAPGSVVGYRCRVDGGGSRDGRVSVEPGSAGQFVYTGARPSGIELHVISLAGAAPMADEFLDPPGRWPTSTSDPYRDDDRWRSDPPPSSASGYPPAY